MGTVTISEHYEVDMNTHVLNYMLAYTYRLILTHTHTPDLALISHSRSLFSSLLSLSLYCHELFYNLMCLLFVYVFMHLSTSLYIGAKKYLVSHQLCKFSHLKERPVIFIIGTLQL